MESLSDEDLLDLRFCDLPVRIDGTWLEVMVAQLHDELSAKGVRVRPHVWLSTEWFTPDGVPGIAIPFYLAHPRLMRLERRQFFDVEGGTRETCMRILRHEAGHAIDNAYRLRRKREWARVFGLPSRAYPESYRPNPFRRDFVLHLDWWYAQAHPVEDFAETFAVWMRPGSRWKQQYRGWPALKKLEFVDRMMRGLATTTPPVRSKEQSEPLSSLRRTLRQHYAKKRDYYGIDLPEPFDRYLLRLFGEAGTRHGSAATFLTRMKSQLLYVVAQWTGEHPYVVEQFLREMISRCRRLKLRVRRTERQVRQEAAVLLTVQVMHYLQRGGHRIAL
ncbi:MAG: hypothetical protein HC813_03215 [Planctomycetes bacterium]|nr:hypothetical protein [Planctomycetota bacterium]